LLKKKTIKNAYTEEACKQIGSTEMSSMIHTYTHGAELASRPSHERPRSFFLGSRARQPVTSVELASIYGKRSKEGYAARNIGQANFASALEESFPSKSQRARHLCFEVMSKIRSPHGKQGQTKRRDAAFKIPQSGRESLTDRKLQRKTEAKHKASGSVEESRALTPKPTNRFDKMDVMMTAAKIAELFIRSKKATAPTCQSVSNARNKLRANPDDPRTWKHRPDVQSCRTSRDWKWTGAKSRHPLLSKLAGLVNREKRFQVPAVPGSIERERADPARSACDPSLWEDLVSSAWAFVCCACLTFAVRGLLSSSLIFFA
jgi:hypothetical protein